jgi:starvation-inducible DNA-binding protein
MDDIAGRAVRLGGVAGGAARTAAKRGSLPEYPANAAGGPGHIEALSSTLAAFGRAVRRAIDEANELGEPATAGLFTEVSRGIDKWLRFAEAHPQAERWRSAVIAGRRRHL